MKLIKLSIVLVVLMVSAVPMDAQVADTVVPQSFRYVERDGKPLHLDFYRPHQPRPDSACVVYIFGGGFANGSRQHEGVRRFCQQMAARGFAAVAIDYRLHIPEVDYDTVNLFNLQRVFRDAFYMATEDCAAAVAYICQHADEWGIATNRIVVGGGSAGAITSLQLDYCRASSLPPAAELPAGWRPVAIVAWSGAVYAEHGKPKYKTPPAPTFFLHGDADRIVHYRRFPPLLRTSNYGTKKLHRIFHRKGYSHWLYVYPGIGHEVASLHNYTVPEVCAFIDAEVRDARVVPTEWSKMNVFDLYRL